MPIGNRKRIIGILLYQLHPGILCFLSWHGQLHRMWHGQARGLNRIRQLQRLLQGSVPKRLGSEQL